MNTQCDIGKGLWGRAPKNKDSSFWIQCHYGQSLPNSNTKATINKLFKNNSYLVPDNGKSRCLIGPFQSHAQAKAAKAQLARHKLKDTFIRQTNTQITFPGQVKQPPAPVKQRTVKASNKNSVKSNSRKTLVENRVVLNSVIYSFTFNNLKYHLPRNINSTQEMPPMFVREHEQYWSKVNYASAKNWCQRYGLRLPTAEELKELQTHGQHFLLRNNWPIKSSYWSNTISVYSGEIESINLRSGQRDEYRPLALLYTTCVTAAS
ncbi:hypothetical protein BIT28_04400 [Photobacterium proteolyticum]|uniref:Uncharacterized protein n=1 Tax=Photobacterium proteolyticum TaxID=1903952 RepID=A0A1Q9H1Q1_9GAMM|nr:hypothetical protein BIT28_04400 [Photobacterium proteolyticum]